MAKEKRKNYQEIKNSNDKMMTKETQNALLGVLLFLLCLIGLLENGGPLGRVIRYVFVFMLGTFFPFALLIGCLLGIILFIKREIKPLKLGFTSWSGVIFAISLLVLASENTSSLSSVFKNYRELFSSVDRGGLMVIIDSSLGGGIIGHFFYSLVSSLVGEVGVKLVFFVLMLLFGYLFLKPVLFYFINMFAKHLNKKQEFERIEKNDNDILPKRTLFKDELEVEETIIEKEEKEENLFIDNDIVEDVFDNSKQNKDETLVNKAPILEDLSDENILLNKKIYEERYNILEKESVVEENTNEELFVPKKEVKNDSFDIFSDFVIDKEALNRAKESQRVEELQKEAVKAKAYNVFEDNNNLPIIEKKEEIKQPLAQEIDLVNDMFEPYPSLRETEVQEEIKEEIIENNEPQPFINNDVIPSMQQQNNYNYDSIASHNKEEKVVAYVDPQPEVVQQTPIFSAPKPVIKQEAPIQETPKQDLVNPFKNYQLPSLGLLDDVKDNSYFENKQNAMIKSQLINDKLAALGIKGRVVNQHIAPAFTRYEIALDSAEKMNQFANISKDLQSAVASSSINILAPIPNSMNAGVDVPNAIRGMVGLKDVLSNMSYDVPTLYVGLGKDSVGKTVGINLAETPHLLVAGSTGTGKSVCMNSLIVSLIMHAKPDELKMVMIDPKRVEMASYHNIPHLACPVITDVRKAGVALQKVAKLMHDRFKTFEALAVRNINAYNRMMRKQNKPIMPYYVVFIDEMADLFNHVKSAEQTIIEICSLARAAGIHVVCATQRPSADIITSNIKVNIPSRIAFAVSSIGDSKTVLGQSGAEQLLGKGDMIINVPGQLSFVRAQGAYISDEEIELVTEFIRKQAEPVYNPILLDLEPEVSSDAEFDGSDSKDADLGNMVIEFLKKVAQTSTTKVQNRFNIGYPKAARIMDMLNDKGIIMKDPATKLWVLSDTYMGESVDD